MLKKEYLVSFSIEGVGGSSSYITVEDGKVMTDSVEDEFFALLRKSNKSMLDETESEARDELVEKLTTDDEIKLGAKHAADYRGTDDDMIDAYESWLEDLSYVEIVKIIGHD